MRELVVLRNVPALSQPSGSGGFANVRVNGADHLHLVLNLRGAAEQELRRVRPVYSFSKGLEALVEAYP